MTVTSIDLGGPRLIRVGYLEALIDPAPTGLDQDAVRSVPWGEPTWADDGLVRAASCAWIVSTGAHHVVVDPAGNLDEIIHDPGSTEVHQAAYVAGFADAGVPIEAVDLVVLSHIETVGLSAVRDGDSWRPFFPNARVLVSQQSWDALDVAPPGGEIGDAFVALRDQGVLGTYEDGEPIVDGLVPEWTGMHDPGHCALHVGDAATFVGHLAVTPLHLGTGPCPPQHADPEGAWRWLEAAKASGRLLIGPLWPTPGALRWDPAGHPVLP